VAADFPGLRIVAAHLGGYLMWDQVRRHLAGRDLYFDLAYIEPHVERETCLALMREHGMERILFATDYPWMSQEQSASAFEKLPLSPEERRLVAGENARRLLGLGNGSRPAGQG
jgi:predicted TIM-barrel fold metal-dependent hydrolase